MVLIGAKFLVFPQQRGFDWYEAKFVVSPSDAVLIGAKFLVFPQQRGFDWYEAKFVVSPSDAVLIGTKRSCSYFIWEVTQGYLSFMRYP